MRRERPVRWRREITGLAWCAAWAALLWAVDRPWQDLGGIVHERVRWLQSVVLFTGLLVGQTTGEIARGWAVERRSSHLQVLRRVLYPVLAIGAAGVAILQRAGEPFLVLIVFTGVLSYWAGLDAGLAALPLICGRPHGFRRPIEHESPGRAAARRALG